MSRLLGSTPPSASITGSLRGPSPRRQELTIEPDDAATIGFRNATGRRITLFCTAAFAELRDHDCGKLLTLARFTGGRVIACEDTGDRLAFWIDSRLIFSMPRGPHEWTLYSA